MDVSSCLAAMTLQCARFEFVPVGEMNSCRGNPRSFSGLPITVDRNPCARRVDRLEILLSVQPNFRDSASSNSQSERTKKKH